MVSWRAGQVYALHLRCGRARCDHKDVDPRRSDEYLHIDNAGHIILNRKQHKLTNDTWWRNQSGIRRSDARSAVEIMLVAAAQRRCTDAESYLSANICWYRVDSRWGRGRQLRDLIHVPIYGDITGLKLEFLRWWLGQNCNYWAESLKKVSEDMRKHLLQRFGQKKRTTSFHKVSSESWEKDNTEKKTLMRPERLLKVVMTPINLKKYL